MKSHEFIQTVFKKIQAGIEYHGVIIDQKFYPLFGPQIKVGVQIQCRRVKDELEFKNPLTGQWYPVNQSVYFDV